MDVALKGWYSSFPSRDTPLISPILLPSLPCSLSFFKKTSLAFHKSVLIWDCGWDLHSQHLAWCWLHKGASKWRTFLSLFCPSLHWVTLLFHFLFTCRENWTSEVDVWNSNQWPTDLKRNCKTHLTSLPLGSHDSKQPIRKSPHRLLGRELRW